MVPTLGVYRLDKVGEEAALFFSAGRSFRVPSDVRVLVGMLDVPAQPEGSSATCFKQKICLRGVARCSVRVLFVRCFYLRQKA